MPDQGLEDDKQPCRVLGSDKLVSGFRTISLAEQRKDFTGRETGK